MQITDKIYQYVSDVTPSGDFQQDVFVHLLEIDAPDFETDVDREKWINIVISNLGGNTYITKFRRQHLEIEHEAEIRETFGYDNVADDPLDILLAEELEAELLESLSELELDIYSRVLGNGVTYKDVAIELNMSEEAVRKHVSRIKRKFNGKED